MKYCNDYAALLDLYVDGELSPDEMIRVQEHLDMCPGCQAYVDDVLAMRAAFPDAEDTVVPQHFTDAVMDAVRKSPRQGRRTSWMKILAPLAACFAIVLVLQNGPVSNKEASKAAPAAREFTKTEEAAAESAAEDMVLQDTMTYAAEPESAMEYKAELEMPMGSPAEGKLSPTEDAAEPEKESAVKSENGAEVFLSALYLPAEAAELLEDFTPTGETETEVYYQLLRDDCERLQAQLEEAGIIYMVEDGIHAATNVSLVILSK